MHHPPFGPYRPNKPFGMTLWVVMRILEFLITGNLDDFSNQGWKTQATGQWLMEQYEGTAPVAFIGHDHKDALNVIGSVAYVRVTSASSEGASPWGYRLVRVENGAITDYVYTDLFPSVPAGNLLVEPQGPVDGSAAEVEFQITTGLPEAHDVVLEAALKTDPNGYVVEGGALLDVRDLGNGATKVWIKAPVPAAPALEAPITVSEFVSGATPPPASPPPPPLVPTYPACGGNGGAGSVPAGADAGAGYLLTILAGFWLVLRLKKPRGAA